MNPLPTKPKKNLIMPVAPMFETIMAPRAKALMKKLCKVVNIADYVHISIDVPKESAWNLGPDNDNLEMAVLDVGTLGMVVGVAGPKTVLRFLVVTKEQNQEVDGIYHVSVLNLELATSQGER